MTEQQKAQAAQRRAARKEAQAKRWEQEQKDRALIGEAMRAILADDKSTTRERVFAALTLDNVSVGSLVPWKAAKLYDVDLGDFKKEVEAFMATQTTT